MSSIKVQLRRRFGDWGFGFGGQEGSLGLGLRGEGVGGSSCWLGLQNQSRMYNHPAPCLGLPKVFWQLLGLGYGEVSRSQQQLVSHSAGPGGIIV